MPRFLQPLILRPSYHDPLEDEIMRIFNELMYGPLLRILGMKPSGIENYEIKNSGSALLDAIKAGTVWYSNGQFQGRFNAKISAALIRLGASFNSPSGSWSLSSDNLPIDIKIAQAQADMRYSQLQRSMLTTLGNIDPKQVDKISDTESHYEKTISSMEADLQKTLPHGEAAIIDNPASARDRVVIEAKLTDGQKKIIADEWGTNLDKYIKGWTAENILRLREEIEPRILAGGRAMGLVKTLQDNYGVGLRKAKFLARQETSLLMSKFQETRYLDMGLPTYRWSDSHDQRVRHDHHLLNGKIFRWDKKPVTNLKTGARNHPGEDFGCRCIAIPML